MQTTAPRRAIPDSPLWTAQLGSVRVHYGAGRLQELGERARSLGCSRALLVSDPGVRAAGHVDRALSSLRDRGLEVELFDRVQPNPTSDQVEDGVAFAAPLEIDLIVALGGGSPMDCAKGINFLLTNGGKMEDYWGYGKASRPLLPAIGVPSTAGTGSEGQSYALVSDPVTGRKMACGDSKALFREVILDPQVSCSAPGEVAAAAGIDALSHALESYVTRSRTEESMELARRAWKLLEANLEAALTGAPLEVHGRVLLGAHLAGAAIETSMLGAAHACSNPLTAKHGVQHGHAVGLMLPAVIRWNAETDGERYDGLSPGGAAAMARRYRR